MASVATKHRAENKSYKIKYKALKELEKGTSYKDVASLLGVPKNTLPAWKKNKDKMLFCLCSFSMPIRPYFKKSKTREVRGT